MPERVADNAYGRRACDNPRPTGKRDANNGERQFMKSLAELRARLDVLDHELLRIVAERQVISADIAAVKRATGQSTRDYRREREVLVKAREDAGALGVSPALAESILQLLIRGSLTTQEQARVAAQGRGSGRRALVIGGRGKMGRWMADFLASQGFAVTISDPAGEVPGYEWLADWAQADLTHDLIVVATPLKIANDVLSALATRQPRGLVFDIGSLKTPLRTGLGALRSAGWRVTSVHPMFGPDTELLSGRHVIFIDLGDAEALEEARSLFASTMADLIVMGLDEHDRLIAFVLGLAHALNIAFFTALADSGEAAPRLARMSSTTFDAQLEVATRVASENPDLYYEIQSLNAYGEESLAALRSAVERIWRSVHERDAASFVAMMRRGSQYLRVRQAAREQVAEGVPRNEGAG